MTERMSTWCERQLREASDAVDREVRAHMYALAPSTELVYMHCTATQQCRRSTLSETR